MLVILEFFALLRTADTNLGTQLGDAFSVRTLAAHYAGAQLAGVRAIQAMLQALGVILMPGNQFFDAMF